MQRHLLFIIALLSVLVLVKQHARCEEGNHFKKGPKCGVPQALAEVWLRFHNAGLCEDIDASFTFLEKGMEVRSLVREGRSYQRFQQMLEPLRSSFKIDLQSTLPSADKDGEEKASPPPSLWQNYELRSYLGDPIARLRIQSDFEAAEQSELSTGDSLLKSRILAFAERILDWSGKMEQYAADLPALVSMALETCWPHEMRLLAASICRAHSQNIQKYARKLDRDLIHALPKSTTKGNRLTQHGETPAAKSVTEAAENIAVAAQSAATRIRNFIYPQQYTVDLKELRRSSLIESLKELQLMNADFQKVLSKAVRK